MVGAVPGLWVAGETKATIVGIDLSPASVARARERAAELGLTDHARFEVGDLTATGLPEASVDGAISVDVIWSVPNKASAFRECARIRKPGHDSSSAPMTGS